MREEEIDGEEDAAANIACASCSRTSRSAFAGSSFGLAAGAIFSPIRFFPLGWWLWSDGKWDGPLAGSYRGNGNFQIGKQIGSKSPNKNDSNESASGIRQQHAHLPQSHPLFAGHDQKLDAAAQPVAISHHAP